MDQVAIQVEDDLVPQLNHNRRLDLVGSPQDHPYNILEGPRAGYRTADTYFLPVASFLVLRFVDLSPEKYSSTGLAW